MPQDLSIWTWEQFNKRVDELCPLESVRLIGATESTSGPYAGSSVYYRKQIRQAVLDLQNFIPEYCRRNETVYFNSDLTTDGACSVGALPPMAKVKEAWYYSVDRQQREPVEEVPWGDRFNMGKRLRRLAIGDPITPSESSLQAVAILGTLEHRHRHGYMAISPDHLQFYITPQIQGPLLFSIFWDGQKLNYRDCELVPFEEEAAQAVAFYVIANFATYIERDPMRASQFNGLYNTKRTNIFTRTKEKGYIK